MKLPDATKDIVTRFARDVLDVELEGWKLDALASLLKLCDARARVEAARDEVAVCDCNSCRAREFKKRIPQYTTEHTCDLPAASTDVDYVRCGVCSSVYWNESSGWVLNVNSGGGSI